MNSDGTAYVLQWSEEILPDFINAPSIELLSEASAPPRSAWVTLFISGGRRDKISKGDIAGLFFKKAELKKEEVGIIELKEDCAFVAVLATKMNQVIEVTDNTRLKKKKVRVQEI